MKIMDILLDRITSELVDLPDTLANGERPNSIGFDNIYKNFSDYGIDKGFKIEHSDSPEDIWSWDVDCDLNRVFTVASESDGGATVGSIDPLNIDNMDKIFTIQPKGIYSESSPKSYRFGFTEQTFDAQHVAKFFRLRKELYDSLNKSQTGILAEIISRSFKARDGFTFLASAIGEESDFVTSPVAKYLIYSGYTLTYDRKRTLHSSKHIITVTW